MNELINFLQQVDGGEIPVISSVQQDLIDIVKWMGEKPLNRNTVRQFLFANNRYKEEEDIDYFMRDLYTVYVNFTKATDKYKITRMIRDIYDKGGNPIREIMDSGFKCYPVAYTKGNNIILGIITNVGHIIVA